MRPLSPLASRTRVNGGVPSPRATAFVLDMFHGVGHQRPMAVSKAYEFRIYPDADQETLLRRTVGCRRFIRNLCLEQVQLERERSDPRRITAVDQINELAALKAEPETAWLAEVPHHVLQQAIIDLHKGFEGFFKGEARFPKRHRKHRGDSCRFPDAKQFEWNDAGIRLPKLGWVEWVMHRPVEGKPKSVTVKRVAGRWFAVVLAELPDAANAPANVQHAPRGRHRHQHRRHHRQVGRHRHPAAARVGGGTEAAGRPAAPVGAAGRRAAGTGRRRSARSPTCTPAGRGVGSTPSTGPPRTSPRTTARSAWRA